MNERRVYGVSSRYLNEATGEWSRWRDPLSSEKTRESAVHDAEVLNHRSMISEHRVVSRVVTDWEVDAEYVPSVTLGGDPLWWPGVVS